MVPVSVGRFYENDIPVAERNGIPQDFKAPRAEVAGENHGFRPAILFRREFNACRPQHVACPGQPNRHTVRHGKRLHVLGPLKLSHRLLDLLGVVEGLNRRLAGPFSFPVGPGDVISLHFGGIAQDQRSHLDGRRRGVHRPFEPALGQHRQPAAMIQVSMGQDHGVQFPRLQTERHPVEFLRLAPALEHPEIDQDVGARRLHMVSRTRDETGRSVECDFHVFANPV